VQSWGVRRLMPQVRANILGGLVQLCESPDVDCCRYSIMTLCNLAANHETRSEATRGGGSAHTHAICARATPMSAGRGGRTAKRNRIGSLRRFGGATVRGDLPGEHGEQSNHTSASGCARRWGLFACGAVARGDDALSAGT
jgi:hypothetical protein